MRRDLSSRHSVLARYGLVARHERPETLTGAQITPMSPRSGLLPEVNSRFMSEPSGPAHTVRWTTTQPVRSVKIQQHHKAAHVP